MKVAALSFPRNERTPAASQGKLTKLPEMAVSKRKPRFQLARRVPGSDAALSVEARVFLAPAREASTRRPSSGKENGFSKMDVSGSNSPVSTYPEI